MSSMKPIALAAREPRGPALMVLTRTECLRPASQASTLVSDSSACGGVVDGEGGGGYDVWGKCGFICVLYAYPGVISCRP
jgi:hypothetical protein